MAIAVKQQTHTRDSTSLGACSVLALLLMTTLVSPAQLAQLRLVFARADKTGAGSLSAAQVAAVLKIALGGSSSAAAGGSSAAPSASAASAVSEMLIQDLLSEIDVGADGGDGRCDFAEFVNLFSRKYADASSAADPAALSSSDAASASPAALPSAVSLLSAPELAELKSAFAALDLDGDALLSPKDLQRAFREALGEALEITEIEAMVREMDTTGKGRIRLADFLAAMSPA